MNDLVRYAREESGLSQRALAKNVGVTGSTIQKYEDGKLGVSLDTLKAISENTGKELNWFLVQAGYLEERDSPTPRQALDVLTELVETAEAQERQLSQFRAVVLELAGEDPENWSAAVKAVMGGGTHPSPHSARSGEVKSSEVGNRFHGRRRGKEDRAESDASGQTQ